MFFLEFTQCGTWQPPVTQYSTEGLWEKKWAWTLESALHHYWTCSVEQAYHKSWTWTLNYTSWQYWYHMLEQVVTNAEIALWSTCLAANEPTLYGFCVPQLLSLHYGVCVLPLLNLCLSPCIMVLLRPMCSWDIKQVCPNYWVVLWSMGHTTTGIIFCRICPTKINPCLCGSAITTVGMLKQWWTRTEPTFYKISVETTDLPFHSIHAIILSPFPRALISPPLTEYSKSDMPQLQSKHLEVWLSPLLSLSS